MRRGKERRRAERSRKSRHRAGEQDQHFLLLSLSSNFFPSPLVSNLIFITAESLKQFAWSASDRKIDNCDPPFLPGKQKRRAEVMCHHVLFLNVCVHRGVKGSIMPEEGRGGVREVLDKEKERESERESGSDRDREGRVGGLFAGRR